MKRLLTLLLLAFLTPVAASAAKATVTLSVSGWTCGGCAASTKVALRSLEGIEDVKTHWKKGEAVVTYDDTKIGPEKMIEEIRKQGYRAAVRDGRAAAGPSAAKTEKSCHPEALPGEPN